MLQVARQAPRGAYRAALPSNTIDGGCEVANMNDHAEREKTMMLQRRSALQALGLGLAACITNVGGLRQASAKEGEATSLLPSDGHHLRQLSELLAKTPRQRSFKTVPMILNDPEQWDAEALKAIIAYPSPYKQVWDNTDLGGPWLNLMRNSLNAQVWSFKHPDFLVVSATHGSAHLADCNPARRFGSTLDLVLRNRRVQALRGVIRLLRPLVFNKLDATPVGYNQVSITFAEDDQGRPA